MPRNRGGRVMRDRMLGFVLLPEELELLSEEEKEEYATEMEWVDKKTAGYTNRLTPSELAIIESAPFYNPMHEHYLYRPDESKIVESGAWVLVNSTVPVSDDVKPMKWAMYWATPCHDSKGDGFDSGGRYKVDVMVRNRATGALQSVGMFPHEYIKVTDTLFEELMGTNGYTLQKSSDNPIEGGMKLELIEKGRSLTEDERSIIWSLQVDGLHEAKACEEYFMGRHTDNENSHIWYMPCDECAQWLENTFGRIGRLTEVNHERRAAARASRQEK